MLEPVHLPVFGLGICLYTQYDDVGPQSVVHVSEEAGIDLKLPSLFDQDGAFRRSPTQLATLTAPGNCLRSSSWVNTYATSYLDHGAPCSQAGGRGL